MIYNADHDGTLLYYSIDRRMTSIECIQCILYTVYNVAATLYTLVTMFKKKF